MTLTAQQIALLIAHLGLLALNVMILLDALRARDSKPTVIDKQMFKVVRPGDVAILHFQDALSDRAYASFKKGFGNDPALCAANLVLLDSCRSVMVLQLPEKSKGASNDRKSGNDESPSTSDKSIDGASGAS